MCAMMKRLLLPLLLLLAPFVLCAQQNASSDVPFNGLVKDLSGKGVKVRVSVKNSDKRTVADREGRFGLTNLEPDDTLLLQYRREKVEIPLEGRRSLKVLWSGTQPSYEEDEELVDLGFGYVKRREYAGSSSGITGDMMLQKGFTDLQTALLTLVPGLQLVNGELVIRGQSSVNSSSAALIVCDGMPVSNLSSISIYEVKSVEVQRGSNMYGVRGGNGVILIRTRDK